MPASLGGAFRCLVPEAMGNHHGSAGPACWGGRSPLLIFWRHVDINNLICAYRASERQINVLHDACRLRKRVQAERQRFLQAASGLGSGSGSAAAGWLGLGAAGRRLSRFDV